MLHFTRRLTTPVILAGLAALASCALWQPIGSVSMIDPPTPERQAAATGTPMTTVEVYGFLTGWVDAPANILIDQSSDALTDDLRQPQWVPSVAYAVHHPDHGVVVLDTGLRSGSCDYGLRPIYWVPCRNEAGQDLVSQLVETGVGPDEIRYIVPSHFHGDHISGLEALAEFTDAPVLTTAASVSEVRSFSRFAKGIPGKMLVDDMVMKTIDAGLVTTDDGLQRFDVFGDGSLVLLVTPGHTKGHVSALIRGTEKNLLLTFDASHLKANFDLTVPSGAVSSAKIAKKSLEQLQVLASNYPDTDVIFGHEPTQWSCVDGPVRLDEAEAPCAP